MMIDSPKVGKLYYVYEEWVGKDWTNNIVRERHPSTFFYENAIDSSSYEPYAVQQNNLLTKKIGKTEVVLLAKLNDTIPNGKYCGHRVIYNGIVGWISSTRTVFQEAKSAKGSNT
jgi:hypothetical protein